MASSLLKCFRTAGPGEYRKHSKLHNQGVESARLENLRKVERAEESGRLEAACSTILVINQLVHNLQSERGLSTIYTASKGQLLKDFLPRTRGHVDVAWEQLAETQLVDACAVDKDELELLRKKVDGLSSPYDQIQDMFDNAIERLLERTKDITKALKKTEIKGIAGAYLIFTHGKESIGRFRARVGAILASGNDYLSEANHMKLVTILTSIESYNKCFMMTAPDGFGSRFEEINQAVPPQVNILITKILTGREETQATLATMVPEEWYRLMSERMNNLVSMQYSLATKLREEAARFLPGGSVHVPKRNNSPLNLADALKADRSAEAHSYLQNGTWHIPLEQLTLEQELGRGATGSTYLGKWDGNQVAVKVINDDTMMVANKKDSLMKDYIRELQALCKMRHPNVLPFLGASISPPRFCLVLEYMDAGTLWGVLRRDPQSLDFFGLALQLARGIKYIHEVSNLIHRDIKSPNLLLNGRGELKISDFGMTLVGGTQAQNHTNQVGTLRWMAPEVLLAQPYSFPADIYSLGIILWELLTKDIPWRAASADNMLPVILSYLNKDMRPEIPAGTPKALAELINDCWHPLPEKRPTSGKVLERLEAANASVTTESERSFVDSVHLGGGVAEFNS